MLSLHSPSCLGSDDSPGEEARGVYACLSSSILFRCLIVRWHCTLHTLFGQSRVHACRSSPYLFSSFLSLLLFLSSFSLNCSVGVYFASSLSLSLPSPFPHLPLSYPFPSQSNNPRHLCNWRQDKTAHGQVKRSVLCFHVFLERKSKIHMMVEQLPERLI